MMSHNKSYPKSYYVIAVILPIIVLLAAELLLRLFDYKPYQALFIPAPSLPGYLQPNPHVIERFFPEPEMAPDVSPDTQYFLQNKPDDSFRIVVQGGSTAAGFPYGRWGSLSGMLQQRFKRLYPEKNIEVINTAMASVNSFTLLDFVDEIIAIKPDLVLVYAGHNEYLGIMGVGSAFASRGGYSTKLLFLKLKNVKLFRLVESIYYGILKNLTTPDSDHGIKSDQRSLMAQIAKDKNIAFGSELYFAGITQFSSNMSLILDKYQQQSIPVIIGNLVSNEKDLAPFSSLVESNSDAANYYQKGLAALASNQLIQARTHFQQARDYDSFRFRAPLEFNRVIDTLANRQLVYFADVDTTFRQDSADGLIGKKHMLEHLHPTVRGYFLLGDAYLQAILDNNLLARPKHHINDTQSAWLEQPVSKADALYGEFKIARLTADYPFTNEPKKVTTPAPDTLEQKALHWREEGMSWLQINQQLLLGYQKQNDIAESAKIAGLLADALPDQFQATYVAGMLYKKNENLPLSSHHLLRAIALNANEINARLSLAQNYFLLEQHAKSLQLLQQVRALEPTHPQVNKLIRIVEQAK